MIELKKSYNPDEIENKWYSYWEERGYFKPNLQAPRKPFSIVIPPPNITGSLHMGHALNATIQDILVRWKRMLGHKVLWLPGTDHAGIATQNVVERELAKNGLDRYKVGREEFIEMVWKWKEEYGGRIIHQLKRLGASCDWSRERFTLDEGLSEAVREIFVRLFEEGLIYRDSRLINWCPRCHTALSDLEVEHEEIEGKLYEIRYPISNSFHSKYITVATTRPETMLGDVAVAVHPEDDRYKGFIGLMAELPLTGRKIPIIGDLDVNKDFGTGAVKITPAHDFNDELIAKRHNLSSISVISEDGKMSEAAGHRYKGLDRYQCRKKILEDLEELGLLEGQKKYLHSVGHCYRCKTIIEPLLTVQWYVKIQPLAKEAIKAVEEKKIRLIPDSWENNYFAWMKDIKDWCISRQIWWGHQIPVWYCPACKNSDGITQGDLINHTFYEPITTKDGKTLYGGTYSELRSANISSFEIIRNSKIIKIPKNVYPICSREKLKECPKCGSKELIRDPDVLDTWFSSALWPFSTLGWPLETEDLRTFYPTSVLVTGFDIIFFWVARMIMMGLKFMNEVPFKDVYIHALVRDSKGQKMSKSKGNVIDPLHMIERYGADAFRFTLAVFAAQGRDVRFSEERVEGYRHFINKIWNAAKFIVSNYQHWTKRPLEYKELDLPSRWILHRLAITVENVNRDLENYRFNDAANNIYQFIWHEFCDWYIEFTKPAIYQTYAPHREVVINCLFYVLENIIKLLHPFMPFVTEELWNEIFREKEGIIVAPFPEKLPIYPEDEEKMNYVINAIAGIRSIRGELNIPPSLEIRANIKTASEDVSDTLERHLFLIKKLSRCKDIIIGTDIEKPKGSAISVHHKMEIFIPIEGLLDVESEIERLKKEKSKITESLSFLRKKLSNEEFLNNAPKNVIQKDREKFEELTLKLQKIEENLRLLHAYSKI
jgi:valyl-tRNA synthetase